jgi:glycosyltransferase involved in cell wall biosynthesis
MRIAFITSEYSGLPGSGGVGTYFHQAAKCLSALGHEVEILTSGVEGDLPPLQRVSYIHLGNDHPRLFCHRAALALRERHQHKPFDILEYAELNAEGYLASELVPEIARVVRIHAPSVILNRYLDFPRSKSKLMHDLANNLRSIIGARRCGIPVPPLAFEPVYFPWPSGSDAEERRAVDSADLVVVMSEEMRNFVIRHWWIEGEKIMKTANPLILPADFDSISSATSSKKRTIGFAGRLEPRKGLVELALALRAVLPRHSSWTAEILGRDSPSCISGISSLRVAQTHLRGVNDRVMFMQELTHQHVLTWLPQLEIFAFPSLWDNFPYAILEAMAAGCAIVASNTGAVREMLGSTGILVPPGDSRALARALDGLMRDDARRAHLGQLAKQRYQAIYAPSQVVNDMVYSYEVAIKRAAQASRK